tara:strand:- start:637 stop:891 length:255 start_codon:yes stop_codon:yes gene_type:complete
MARESEQIATDYAAMVGMAGLITDVIAGNFMANDAETGQTWTKAERKARITRSAGYLSHMVALGDWGSEDMTAVNSAISAAGSY